MATSNPALSDKVLQRMAPAPTDLQPGWGAPVPPAPDEVSPWVPSRPVATMTVGGAVSATAVLLVLLCAAGFVGWMSVDDQGLGGVELPGWIFASFFVALGLAIATIVRPQWARITAPLYAIAEGTVVGAISHLYEREFDGIVLQAAGLTVGVLAIMLFIYGTGIIKVTDKLRIGIICATGAVALVYLFDIVLSLFDAEVPFIHETGGVGIAISLVIVVIAAMNLLLDFDFVERGVAARAPKSVEWYAGFGLLLTLVWLYLELLRLLAKLQRR